MSSTNTTRRQPQPGDVYLSLAKADHTDAWQKPDGTLTSADRYMTVTGVDSRYIEGRSWWSAEPARSRKTRVEAWRLQTTRWRLVPADEVSALLDTTEATR